MTKQKYYEFISKLIKCSKEELNKLIIELENIRDEDVEEKLILINLEIRYRNMFYFD